jgi:tripartite-type tricarboxylate transporter receptor subunit TctC
MIPIRIGRLFIYLLVATLTTLAGVASAGPGEDFFRGKRLTYIVATKPGGGYDTTARLIARHLPKHLPVQSVAIKNIPGAGHLIGARQLAIATADGLTIGTFNSGLIYSQMQDAGALGLDLRRLGWVGKADSEPRVFVVGAQSSIRSMADMQQVTGEILLASSGKASASNIEALMIGRALGLRFTPVQGFSGAEGELALLRGDVTGMLASYSSVRGFIDDGHGRVLFYVGEKPAGLADVPPIDRLVTDVGGRATARLITATAQLARLTATPPGVPAERLAALRKAYLSTLADPALLAEARTLKLSLAPLGGEAVKEHIDSLLSGSPAALWD